MLDALQKMQLNIKGVFLFHWSMTILKAYLHKLASALTGLLLVLGLVISLPLASYAYQAFEGVGGGGGGLPERSIIDHVIDGVKDAAFGAARGGAIGRARGGPAGAAVGAASGAATGIANGCLSGGCHESGRQFRSPGSYGKQGGPE